ncbi:unnamed protein product [Urochloa decumbens]|uniref:DUF3615 domain-containing protein n=1 Tax=Urochloa decumbens TaxID=240449 RepID=A0ABC8VG33_9POAL
MDADDDSYFKSLDDNFIIAYEDVCKPSEKNTYKEAAKRQSETFAESALKHYNNDKNNKVKYDLISAITSCGILDMKGFFGHVNFIAKGKNQQNSKEELFFAELHLEHDTFVPTSVLSLEGVKKVDFVGVNMTDSMGLVFLWMLNIAMLVVVK